MLSATELGFETRRTDELPAWIKENSIRIWPLTEAKTLRLRRGAHDVLVLLRERSSVLVGEIASFEPPASALAGMHVGDLIVFSHAHVLAAPE
jgi:hypothetical protein